MGWTVGQYFFSRYLENELRFFLNNGFLTSFGMFSETKSECSFFQTLFSQKNLQVFLKYQENCSIYFIDCFCSPFNSYEDIFRNFSKKSNNLEYKKNWQLFFFFGGKNVLFGNILKTTKIFSWLFLVPLEEYKSHLLEHSKTKKLKIFHFVFEIQKIMLWWFLLMLLILYQNWIG